MVRRDQIHYFFAYFFCVRALASLWPDLPRPLSPGFSSAVGSPDGNMKQAFLRRPASVNDIGDVVIFRKPAELRTHFNLPFRNHRMASTTFGWIGVGSASIWNQPQSSFSQFSLGFHSRAWRSFILASRVKYWKSPDR